MRKSWNTRNEIPLVLLFQRGKEAEGTFKMSEVANYNKRTIKANATGEFKRGFHPLFLIYSPFLRKRKGSGG